MPENLRSKKQCANMLMKLAPELLVLLFFEITYIFEPLELDPLIGVRNNNAAKKRKVLTGDSFLNASTDVKFTFVAIHRHFQGWIESNVF